MNGTLPCAVCGVRGRVPPEVTDEPRGDLRQLCNLHSGHIGALLGGGGEQ